MAKYMEKVDPFTRDDGARMSLNLGVLMVRHIEMQKMAMLRIAEAISITLSVDTLTAFGR